MGEKSTLEELQKKARKLVREMEGVIKKSSDYSEKEKKCFEVKEFCEKGLEQYQKDEWLLLYCVRARQELVELLDDTTLYKPHGTLALIDGMLPSSPKETELLYCKEITLRHLGRKEEADEVHKQLKAVHAENILQAEREADEARCEADVSRLDFEKHLEEKIKETNELLNTLNDLKFTLNKDMCTTKEGVNEGLNTLSSLTTQRVTQETSSVFQKQSISLTIGIKKVEQSFETLKKFLLDCQSENQSHLKDSRQALANADQRGVWDKNGPTYQKMREDIACLEKLEKTICFQIGIYL